MSPSFDAFQAAFWGVSSAALKLGDARQHLPPRVRLELLGSLVLLTEDRIEPQVARSALTPADRALLAAFSRVLPRLAWRRSLFVTPAKVLR